MPLTKEQRLERARKRMDQLRKATKTRSRTDRMDWRPKAKIVLHPDSDIIDRQRVWFPKVIEEKDDGEEKGKKKKKGGKTRVVNVPFNVPEDPKDCPFAELRRRLKEDAEIDGDEIIISVGSGRSKVELCKGEILGWDGYDFRKRLSPQSDFVTVAVKIEDAKGKRPAELKAETLSAAKSLGNDIRKEIESETDEGGEEASPFFTPYPIIIKYDESERGSDMYSARARPQEADVVAEDEELMKILDEEAPSLEDEIKIDDVEAMVAMINAAIVWDGLEVAVEGTPSAKAPQKGKKAPEPADEPEDPEPDPEPEEPAEEPKEPDPEPDPEPEPEPEEEDEVAKAERLLAEAKAKKAEAEKKKKAAAKKDEKPKATRKPREKKAAAKKEEPKKDLGWTPGEDEDYDICPKCREPVPQDATECPHPGCDAVYATEDGDPF